jgi:predicted nucleic acid-binding protein
LRTLDAIHVASAQQLGWLLDVLITYDHRMAAGAPADTKAPTGDQVAGQAR